MPDAKRISGEQSDRVCESGVRESVFTYSVADNVLAHGSSLGNAHGWATSKGTGAVQSLFCVDIGLEVTGSLVINFLGSYHDLLVYNPERDRMSDNTLVRLSPVGVGQFTLHPAYQEHTYEIIGGIHVKNTFFLPNTGFEDETSAIQIVEMENRSGRDQELEIIGCLDLPGTTPKDLSAEYDHDLGALLAWNESHTDWVRAFGCTPSPDGFLVTHDIEQAWNPRRKLKSHADERGDVLASLRRSVKLKAGAKAEMAFVIAFSPKGRDAARSAYSASTRYREILGDTIERYRCILGKADVMTPDALINQGTQWCKANMLRVLARYPTGIAFTNDPGRSTHIVVRDAAWFIYGSDYILPEASCELLKQIAERQQESGKIVEYYDGLDGSTEDYGLNINDDTPLFILAAAHHLNVVGHDACGEALHPSIIKAADYIISQEDDRGLVYCTAEGTGAHGIAGWRNIIQDTTISGAVTEVNAESYAALTAVSKLARLRGDDELADHYGKKASELREAINTHLMNPHTGMYYLNIDTHGNPITEITTDEVFPMIFGAAEEDTGRRIRLRLSNADFMTDAGLRTSSSLDPLYAPDTLAGLQGGVWPGVTWWYAMAAVDADPGLMVESLKRSYQQYIVRPPAYNTVPGQFSEWFDGQSLVNRGMRLSPWEPPRFLWAMIEGAVGLDVTGDQAVVKPRVPFEWKWLRVQNLRNRLGEIGFFAARHADQDLTFYTTSRAMESGRTELYDGELTLCVDAIEPDTIAAAYERESDLIVCFGNTSGDKKPAPFTASKLLTRDREYGVLIYQSETGQWLDMGSHSGASLGSLSTDIEPYGFVLFRFVKQQSDGGNK